jgi:hypothetical protein
MAAVAVLAGGGSVHGSARRAVRMPRLHGGSYRGPVLVPAQSRINDLRHAAAMFLAELGGARAIEAALGTKDAEEDGDSKKAS